MLRFEKAAVPKTRAHKVYQSLGGSDKTCENPDVNFPQQLAEGAGAGRSQAFLLTRRVHPKRSASRGHWGVGSHCLQSTKWKGKRDVHNNKPCPCCRGASVVRCPKYIYTHIIQNPFIKQSLDQVRRLAPVENTSKVNKTFL